MDDGANIVRGRLEGAISFLESGGEFNIDGLLEILRGAVEQMESDALRLENLRARAAPEEVEAERDALRALLSAAKVWRQATESRLRMLSTRESTDNMLLPDQRFFDAIDETRSALASIQQSDDA